MIKKSYIIKIIINYEYSNVLKKYKFIIFGSWIIPKKEFEKVKKKKSIAGPIAFSNPEPSVGQLKNELAPKWMLLI